MRLRPSFDNVGNLSPLVAKLEPLLEELLIFFEGPLALLYRWIKRRQPSLPALLPVSRREYHLVAIFVRCVLY